MAESGSDLILVARAVRTHGLKGEVVAELLTDFPERFEELDEVIVVAPSGERKTLSLEDFWFQKDRVVLKLSGYDDVEAAKQLIGYELAVPESDRVQLEVDMEPHLRLAKGRRQDSGLRRKHSHPWLWCDNGSARALTLFAERASGGRTNLLLLARHLLRWRLAPRRRVLDLRGDLGTENDHKR